MQFHTRRNFNILFLKCIDLYDYSAVRTAGLEEIQNIFGALDLKLKKSQCHTMFFLRETTDDTQNLGLSRSES